MSVYKNGNTIVEIREDGTKIRFTKDDVPENPEFPESIDMKITNRCEVGCPQCHECSTPNGAMANLKHPLLDSLHAHTELAIGGGDPMTHPDLERFLMRMAYNDVICNITVHWTSFLKHYKTLKTWANIGLIHGLGVSINEIVQPEVIIKLAEFKNAVVHTIVGVATAQVYRQLMDRDFNLLLLGYKTFGRGEKYSTENPERIQTNAQWIQDHLMELGDHFKVVSFDNLAIEQTHLKDKLEESIFDQIYMGDDGTYTMYIDLVKNEFAASSTSKDRKPITSNNIRDLFKTIRYEKEK